MNIIEDAANCLPSHPDPPQATKALTELKLCLKLSDGWRKANPLPECQYTFAQPGVSSRSRIDRIYATDKIINRASEWSIENPVTPTDHQLISVRIYNYNAPQIGHGWWTMKPLILNNKKFMNEIKTEGTKATTLLEQGANPQTILQNLIKNIHSKAKLLSKIKIGKINSTIKNHEKKKDKIMKKANSLNSEALRSTLDTASQISIKIQDLQSTLFNKNQSVMKANWHLHGEMVNKYWCSYGKEKKGRDTIMELRRPEYPTPQYTSNSKIMANDMAMYHQDLQSYDKTSNPPLRSPTITSILLDMPNLSAQEKDSINSKLSYTEVEHALTESPNNKAAGTNGIPTDLYKELHKRHKQNSKENKPSFDIVKLLMLAYNDIELNGTNNPSLQAGWLCPLYKKKDHRKIPNYRPITVLNAEYKILTTAIMEKIATIAPNLIHKTQAAFVKG